MILIIVDPVGVEYVVWTQSDRESPGYLVAHQWGHVDIGVVSDGEPELGNQEELSLSVSGLFICILTPLGV
jgi:hypothetical protein